MNFAISTGVFLSERLTPAHLEQLASAGFASVEIVAARSHVDYQDARLLDGLTTALRDAGLEAPHLYAPAPLSAPDEMRQLIDASQRLGCRMLVAAVGNSPGPIDVSAARRHVDALVDLVNGFPLALTLVSDGASSARVLLDLLETDALDGTNTGICLDFGQAQLGDGVADTIETFSGHIVTTHVHDCRGVKDERLVPFSGTIDWPSALMELWKVGYSGALIFDAAARGAAADVIRRTVGARTRLQAILDGLSEPIPFTEE